jgi:Nucleoside-diphosphate-sugar pyrophosphorylase involved in lipopolysaccharide biosynthesis/translation initiation factor 2B, gamma/epsilon subunits (eIF-2Bgamma/eIF-2Bepsilon)
MKEGFFHLLLNNYMEDIVLKYNYTIKPVKGVFRLKAVIMAGGEGSRLRPLTCDLPKPMVPVMNVPLMEHVIELLKLHSITDIAVTLAYLPQRIKEYFGDGSSHGVNLQYYVEDSPLGTAGSIKNVQDFIDGTFLVISGDSLTNLDITSAVDFHKNRKSKATLVLARVSVPLEYGVVLTDSNSSVTGFLEKPSWGEVFSDTVNTGTYILEPEVLELIPYGKKYDFSQELFPNLLAKKEPLFGYIMNGYWYDIGNLNSYLQAHYDVLDGKISVKTNAIEYKKDVWVGHGTIIEPNAHINAPCVIGPNCRIGNGTSIENHSILGSNNVVEDEVSIKKSVIWNNNYIDFGSEIRGAIICNRVQLKHYVSVFENSVIGDDCIINERAIVKPNIKIWPNKSVESLSVVDRNLVWGARHSKTIFGESGLSGIINVDISPEFATRLGAAYGSLFKKGSRVVVSSTNSNSARMFKHAFISGILSVGVEVYNLSSLLTPISRHAISFLSVEGGIHIKLGSDNPNRLKVDFMDSKGATIGREIERKIENVFIREDFKRCSGEEISRLNNITDFTVYYVRMILNEVDYRTIKEKSPSICVVSPSNLVISVAVPMLTDIGCKVISFSSTNLNSLDAVVDEIKKRNTDIGAYIDSNGETLILVDRNGNIIKDDLFLAFTSVILFRTIENAEVVVPVTATSIIEQLADTYNGSVLRTKTSQQAVMEQLLDYNLFKNREKVKVTQFLLDFDALAGLVKIIEYLCSLNTTLEETINSIPGFHMSKKSVYCPWELKGKIMRTLITEEALDKVELLDGVRFITEKGWALVLPDADLPFFNVYSEGDSPESAENISNQYVTKIRSILSNSDTYGLFLED